MPLVQFLFQKGNSRQSATRTILYSFVAIALATLLAVSPQLRLEQLFQLLSNPLTTRYTSSDIPPTMSYAKELSIATHAIHRSTLLTQKVFQTTSKGTTSKSDHSPVTIGDFGAQALIISAIAHAFPDDEIVAEEEASSLRSNSVLASQIWDLVRDTKLEDGEKEQSLGGAVKSQDEMLDLIDRGSSEAGGKGRVWALDPIDGTKGFLRGGQYAVCLALIVNGEVKVGVLGCPNLPIEDSVTITAETGQEQSVDEGKGVLFAAVEGQGAISRSMNGKVLGEERKISMRKVKDIKEAIFCDSVEAAHSSHGEAALIAEKLGVTKLSVRMDSQAKYGAIARGAADIYLRLPTKATYKEKIWDHASGDLIVREAGGIVTDTQGKRLDFSKGKTLSDNVGVVGAAAAIHGQVLEVVKEVLGAKKEL